MARVPWTTQFGVLLAAVVCVGCLTPRSVTPTTRFALDPQATVAAVTPSALTLGIRPIEAGRPYDQHIIYRTQDHELGQYEKAEWAEFPRDVVTRTLGDALIATKRFRDVGNAADLRAPDLVLTGQLRYGTRSGAKCVGSSRQRLALRTWRFLRTAAFAPKPWEGGGYS